MGAVQYIPFQRKNYRIGIDVGDRSVGIAFVEFATDAQGVDHPTGILKMASHRHDGGMDPTTNKTPLSRKATSGVARRVRRLRRRRTKRLKALDALLMKHGLPIVDVSDGETYQCWQARAAAVQGFIENDAERVEAVSRSVRHIARHRGWKNPWWSFEQLSSAPVPSPNQQATLARALERYPRALHGDATLGEIGMVANQAHDMLRLRTGNKLKAASDPLFKEKVMQEDQLAELRKIFEVQNFSGKPAQEIERAVFDQLRPFVPNTNVGADSLPGMSKYSRAVRSTLEFQEFRIRDAVANLRLRTGHRTSEAIPLDLREAIIDHLSDYPVAKGPSWAQVADFINVDPGVLIAPTFDDVQLSSAPYNRTLSTLRAQFKGKNKVVGDWWAIASDEARSSFVELISDASESAGVRAEQSGLMDVLTHWPEEVLQVFLDLNLESGRAAYSCESLQRMNKVMREQGVGLHEARKIAFKVDDTWTPKLPNIESQTGQPTVDRVIATVRKAIMAADARWGAPQCVVVEHVRSGLMGPAARAELRREININKAKRTKASDALAAEGFDNSTRSAIRRYEQVKIQKCVCLYCGSTITAKAGGCELDHVVPRSGGGSNRRSNLVAVCRGCNASKGKLPFAVWAEKSSNPEISVAASVKRLRLWDKKDYNPRTMRDLQLRLKRTSEDAEIDERSLESTAYAAREVRQRIDSYFEAKLSEDQNKYNFVRVYEGAVTRSARRASGIDNVVSLRGKSDKDRFDYRHHAVDAAVMTILEPRIALILRERNNIRDAERMVGDAETWKTYKGRSTLDHSYFDGWRNDAQNLANMVNALRNADRIPVTNQLRLNERNGSVHKDKPSSLLRLTVGDAWSVDNIRRVIDPQQYLALHRLWLSIGSPKDGLPKDDARALVTPLGQDLSDDDVIAVVGGSAASIIVRNGSVEIGESIHHARIFGWLNRKGEFECGMLRVFGAEFPYLKRMTGSADVLTMQIDPGSFSYRDLQDKVRKPLESGSAKEIGWLTQNDELEIDVEAATQRKDKLGEFLKIYPESRWRVDGFTDNRSLRLRPALLALEGIADDEPPLAEEALKTGLIINLGSLMAAPHTKVIRRNALGDPIWRGDRQAVSWEPAVRFNSDSV